jgi:hypothetical protein
VPYYNVLNFKSEIYGIWAIDKTWPTLDKFYYSYNHKWKKKNFRCPYKIWNKFISFDMKKKRKFKTCHSFMKKKMNLGVLRTSPCVSNGVP